jgi:hypothetical protein
MSLRSSLSFDTKGFGKILLALPALAVEDLKVEGDSKRARRASKRAVIAQIQRWKMWAAQGVPLRDEAALMYFAKQYVFRDHKGQHHRAEARKGYQNRPASLGIIVSRLATLAGGSLPVGFEEKAMTVMAKLRDEQHAVDSKRAAARRHKSSPLGMDTSSTTHDRTRVTLTEKAQEAMGAAKFTYALDKRDWETDLPFSYVTGKWSVRECAVEYRSKRVNSRRRRYSATFVPTIGWLMRVGLKGRANRFGERTLVLDWVEVPNMGTIVTLARQKSANRYAIETVRGKYSLDSDSKPKLVDEVVLSVSKMSDVRP